MRDVLMMDAVGQAAAVRNGQVSARSWPRPRSPASRPPTGS
ncbi:hypothetical protein ACFQ0B_11960 [Nonomuraea thailandensis]